MTRRSPLLSLCLLSLCAILLSGCKKNRFEVNFDLSEDVSANYTVVYYASSKEGGFTVQAVAPVMKGIYQLNGVTALPTLLWLNNKSYPRPTLIYAERGEKIQVEGESADPYLWHISGNKINQRLSEWRNLNDSLLLNGTADDVNEAVGTYVKENPEDPVSTLLLLSLFDRRTDEKGFRDLLASLRGAAGDKKWSDLMARPDAPDATLLPPPARLQSMIMRKFPKGLDTLRTDSVKASLIMFWGFGGGRRSPLADTIKALVKEFPDSASRLIADICLETDSIGWRNQVRGDSIKKAVRLWTPFGLADPNLMKLQVYSLPFYMVVSPEGRQEYRGTEIDSALSMFRRLLKE